MVGRSLTKALLKAGHSVRHVSRNPDGSGSVPVFQWNLDDGTIDPEAVRGIEHIIHLAGSPIVEKKWTKDRIQELIDSRAKSARLILNEVLREKVALKGFHSASGSNYYGALSSDHIFTETDPAGKDTIGHITQEWEDAVREFEPICRTVRFRLGIILSESGGALSKLTLPVRYCFGSPLGNGDQWVSWIHIDDVIGLFKSSIENERFEGVFNAVADQAVTNECLIKEIGKALKRPLWAPKVPTFVLKALLGERAKLILNGYQLSNARSKATGFNFKYPKLKEALEDLLN